jgi:hypothetical protein
VRIHPDGDLFVGDLVSLEVLAPGENYKTSTLWVELPGQDEPLSMEFDSAYGNPGYYHANMFWAWDTSGLQEGLYSLPFEVRSLSSRVAWTQDVVLEPAAEIPSHELDAQWAQATSDCCQVHYITHTAAERDLADILSLAEQSAAFVVDRLGVEFAEPFVVTLLPRVYGHGGLVGSTGILVSYLDRNYVRHPLDEIISHEMVHTLDRSMANTPRPALLMEGFAVYLAGGHYKSGDLLPLAAVLLAPSQRADGLGLDSYIPLQDLANNFHAEQHEISYVQAGALVEYMIATWGWETYLNFYHNLQWGQATMVANLDVSLQERFGLSFEQLEEQFIIFLQQQAVTQAHYDEMRLRPALFDTIRRYECLLDTSAYYRLPWFPDIAAMRQQGVVADLTRHPVELENLALETLLVAANDAWHVDDHAFLEEAIQAVNAVLDAVEQQSKDPFSSHPLALAYYQINSSLIESGYQAQNIRLEGDTAWAEVSSDLPAVFSVVLQRNGEGWQLVP